MVHTRAPWTGEGHNLEGHEDLEGHEEEKELTTLCSLGSALTKRTPDYVTPRHRGTEKGWESSSVSQRLGVSGSSMQVKSRLALQPMNRAGASAGSLGGEDERVRIQVVDRFTLRLGVAKGTPSSQIAPAAPPAVALTRP